MRPNSFLAKVIWFLAKPNFFLPKIIFLSTKYHYHIPFLQKQNFFRPKIMFLPFYQIAYSFLPNIIFLSCNSQISFYRKPIPFLAKTKFTSSKNKFPSKQKLNSSLIKIKLVSSKTKLYQFVMIYRGKILRAKGIFALYNFHCGDYSRPRYACLHFVIMQEFYTIPICIHDSRHWFLTACLRFNGISNACDTEGKCILPSH